MGVKAKLDLKLHLIGINSWNRPCTKNFPNPSISEKKKKDWTHKETTMPLRKTRMDLEEMASLQECIAATMMSFLEEPSISIRKQSRSTEKNWKRKGLLVLVIANTHLDEEEVHGLWMWLRRHGKGKKGSTGLRPWSDGEGAQGQVENVNLGERRRMSETGDSGKRGSNGGTGKKQP